MAVNCDVLYSMVLDKLVGDVLAPDDFQYDSSGQIWCKRTLHELNQCGLLEYLRHMISSNKEPCTSDEVNLTPGSPLYTNSKPLSVMTAKVSSSGVELVVEGQQSDRIKEKWEGKYSKILGGMPVKITWDIVHQEFQIAERGGKENA